MPRVGQARAAALVAATALTLVTGTRA